MASIYQATSLQELRTILREADDPGVLAQELVQKGAMHALNELERRGCTSENLAAMQKSIREISAIMNINQAIALLQVAREKLGDTHPVMPSQLIELVFSQERPRLVKEMQARERMVRNALRAKLEAGYSHRADFFLDVWPAALYALKQARKEHNPRRAAVLMAGGEAQREQTCVVIDETETDYLIQPGSGMLVLPNGHRIRCDQVAKVPRDQVRLLR